MLFNSSSPAIKKHSHSANHYKILISSLHACHSVLNFSLEFICVIIMNLCCFSMGVTSWLLKWLIVYNTKSMLLTLNLGLLNFCDMLYLPIIFQKLSEHSKASLKLASSPVFNGSLHYFFFMNLFFNVSFPHFESILGLVCVISMEIVTNLSSTFIHLPLVMSF